MGGQNHQPTSGIRLIGPSAWLSQKLGEGFSAVLQSNNELENAIICAVDKLHVETLARNLGQAPSVYLDRAINHLETSRKLIDSIQAAYEHLLNAAAAENYKGNPLASTIHTLDLAQQFDATLVLPTVNTAAWKCVETRVASDNILRTLDWESKQFASLCDPTMDLVANIRTCATLLASEGNRSFIEAVEWNKIPLRQSYARVFSLWNHLHAMFLYSSLMMTELFYRANGFPSLLETDAKGSRQVA